MRQRFLGDANPFDDGPATCRRHQAGLCAPLVLSGGAGWLTVNDENRVSHSRPVGSVLRQVFRNSGDNLIVAAERGMNLMAPIPGKTDPDGIMMDPGFETAE
ncbi:MAG: hypothetical protein HQL98_08885 [Magnetococcales bacterium]|nr:hypothetical protein [Magnetococcales bacterium]